MTHHCLSRWPAVTKLFAISFNECSFSSCAVSVFSKFSCCFRSIRTSSTESWNQRAHRLVLRTLMLWHLNFYDLYKNSPHVLQYISYSFISENLCSFNSSLCLSFFTSPFYLKKPCCSFNEKTLKADKLRLSSWLFKYYSERVHTPRSSLERNASWEADKESTYSASRMNACKKEKI